MFIYNLKAIAKKLKIDFEEITSKIQHPSEMGAAREELLKTYLSQFLPIKYTVGNGIIVDSNESRSKQQDFIIYDAFSSPLMLKMQSLQIIPVESVYCTIEIKSTLTEDELKKCVNNIKSVRQLEKCRVNRVFEGFGEPIGCVFAYTSNVSLKTLLKHLEEINKDIPKEQQISIVCVLDKGLIFNVRKNGMTGLDLYPNEETVLVRSEKQLEDNLYLFYLLVLEHLNRCELLPPNFIQYAKKQNAFDIKPNLEVDDLPDDGYTDTVIGQMSNKEMKDVHKIFKGITPYLKKGKHSKEDFVDSLIIMGEFNYNDISYEGVIIKHNDIETIKNFNNKIKDGTIIENELNEYNNMVDNIYEKYLNIPEKMAETPQ